MVCRWAVQRGLGWECTCVQSQPRCSSSRFATPSPVNNKAHQSPCGAGILAQHEQTRVYNAQRIDGVTDTPSETGSDAATGADGAGK